MELYRPLRGLLVSVGKHVEFDTYYKHENDTGKGPNQQLNALGLLLNLHF
jgi:hypothetical protein